MKRRPKHRQTPATKADATGSEHTTSSNDCHKNGSDPEKDSDTSDSETVISTISRNFAMATNTNTDNADRSVHAISSTDSESSRSNPKIDTEISDSETVISAGEISDGEII